MWTFLAVGYHPNNSKARLGPRQCPSLQVTAYHRHSHPVCFFSLFDFSKMHTLEKASLCLSAAPCKALHGAGGVHAAPRGAKPWAGGGSFPCLRLRGSTNQGASQKLSWTTAGQGVVVHGIRSTIICDHMVLVTITTQALDRSCYARKWAVCFSSCCRRWACGLRQPAPDGSLPIRHPASSRCPSRLGLSLPHK